MKTEHLEKSPSQITFKRKLALLLSGLLAAYFVTYSILSLGGHYEPSAVGTFGVERYWWAPIGFYNAKHQASNNLGWNKVMCYTFLPLWCFDNSYLHNDRSGGT
jgi:hypothetical protein